jgi:hypothetical protein
MKKLLRSTVQILAKGRSKAKLENRSKNLSQKENSNLGVPDEEVPKIGGMEYFGPYHGHIW